MSVRGILTLTLMGALAVAILEAWQNDRTGRLVGLVTLILVGRALVKCTRRHIAALHRQVDAEDDT